MKQEKIRIAIQKEGRLKGQSVEFLASLGLEFSRANERALVVPCTNADVEILYVRHADAPQYVQNGAADFAVVGGNVLHENQFNVKEVKELNFGICSLVIAVPRASPLATIRGLEGERIATSYPNSLRRFLQKQKINAAVIELKGSVEAAPALGLADAICDLAQTGNTLRENNLVPIETVFRSTAVLIESPFAREQKNEFIQRFLSKQL